MNKRKLELAQESAQLQLHDSGLFQKEEQLKKDMLEEKRRRMEEKQERDKTLQATRPLRLYRLKSFTSKQTYVHICIDEIYAFCLTSSSILCSKFLRAIRLGRASFAFLWASCTSRRLPVPLVAPVPPAPYSRDDSLAPPGSWLLDAIVTFELCVGATAASSN